MVDNFAKSQSGDASEDDSAAQAAAWLARRDRGLSAAEAEALQQWRAADARHAAEFARIDRAWNSLAHAKDVPELAAMARELDERTRPSRRIALVWMGAAAAAAAVVCVLAMQWSPRPSPPTLGSGEIMSRAGLTAERTLSDGSIVALRDDSEIQVDFTPTSRNVRLIRGEAHFTVTKNALRPFIVGVDSVAVRAVGTAFDIRLDSAAVHVLVTEGKVSVAGSAGIKPVLPVVPVLVAGQRAVIATQPVMGASNVVIDSPTSDEMEHALAWKTAWLVFDRTPLAEAVDAFNRHGTKRLVLGDPALRNRPLGGRFRLDNVDAFIRLLEQGADVRAVRRGEDEIVLLPAH